MREFNVTATRAPLIKDPPQAHRSTRNSGTTDGGLLRIDFGAPEENLEEIPWEEFFKIFDRNKLAFLYQDKTSSGGESRFNKFVDREQDGHSS